ncbi:hypothetical protein [Paenibacillus sp. MMS18-CY102]|uniref:hypothetical protein n=1 Tax=Paenibacillus sp. MMS18-CY102 TaxID=2682849 RepID=UPI0013665E8C|nr:hypothetical protein [Paenibacillus sp. MMS18-CY102]MWC31317.1 hypothetical protein [Paenibacillus sp. MMS18-CY102]
MFKKGKILSLTAMTTMSLMLISASVSAENPSFTSNLVPNSNHEIPIDPGPPPANAVTMPQEVGSKELSDLQDDRVQLENYVIEYNKDSYSGSYTENGLNVILLTKNSSSAALENSIKDKSKLKNKLKIKYVKYSRKEIAAAKEKVFSQAEKLKLEAVGINESINKINIYVTQEVLDKNKNEILKYVNEDMVNWVIGDMGIKDNAYYLYPGERIERKIDATNYYTCSLGFNARVNGNDVGVTAGHCANGSYYDLSDGSSSIGTMSNGNNSSTTSYDGGYVNYVSGTIPSVYLNGSAMTIGTTDYSGQYRTVGQYVRIHATSMGGSSTAPLKILDTDLNVTGFPTHLVLTEYGGLISGDSGGLVYTIANNGVKNYARIEGVYKGNAVSNGQIVGEVFSKYSYVYDGLGLSGIYTDNSY